MDKDVEEEGGEERRVKKRTETEKRKRAIKKEEIGGGRDISADSCSRLPLPPSALYPKILRRVVEFISTITGL